MNILLIEDNPADVRLLQRALQKRTDLQPYELIVLEDGESAMEYLFKTESPKPDLIILDLNLMLVDGRQILQELRSSPVYRTTPVIILTTSKNQSDIEEAYSGGANAYLSKPYGYKDYELMAQSLATFWINWVSYL